MMTDKVKHKGNPRRRLLFRLIFGIVIIAAVIASGVYLLRPKGAQIVFIAPDKNGVDNIWIADLSNPENPRQLTFHENMRVVNLEVSQRGYTTIYHMVDRFSNQPYPVDPEIWLINIQTGIHRKLLTCTSLIDCTSVSLNPDGSLFSYRANSTPNNDWTSLFLYDLRSDDTMLFDFTGGIPIQWIDDRESGLLIYRSAISETQFNFYSVSDQNIVQQLDLPDGVTSFTPDGSAYVHVRNLGAVGYADILIDDSSKDTTNPTIIRTTYDCCEFLDWHPDNEYFLISQSLSEGSNRLYELNLYSSSSGEHITLTTNDEPDYTNASFNAEGTQILYIIQLPRVRFQRTQIMLYDMEAGEEIALPLFGDNPQWVNGGR